MAKGTKLSKKNAAIDLAPWNRDVRNVSCTPMIKCKEFDEVFTKFKKETGSVFRIKSSCSSDYENSRRKQNLIPARFKFVSIKYCCVHYGKPKTSGQGIRTKQRYLPCGCESFLSVAYNRGALVVSQAHMLHNHEVSNKLAPYYAMNRRISTEELKQVADVIDVIPTSRALQTFLKEKFHKPMTLQDAKNARQRLRNMKMREGPIESIQVISSFKEISQACTEGNVRAILEIKEENEEFVEKEFYEDNTQANITPNVEENRESEAINKMKALDEMVTKLSDLMSSCSSDIFWQRLGSINEVMKCWENEEVMKNQYKCKSFNHLSEKKYQDDSQESGTGILHCKGQKPKTLNDVDWLSQVHEYDRPEVAAVYSVKSNIKYTEGRNVKSSIPHTECKESIEITKDKGCEDGNYTTFENDEDSCADGQESDIIILSDPRENNLDERRDRNPQYSPYITCITKEPCLDNVEQALEVEIEINDLGVT